MPDLMRVGELVPALQQEGIDCLLTATGEGVYTLYFGRVDDEGYFDGAVGPGRLGDDGVEFDLTTGDVFIADDECEGTDAFYMINPSWVIADVVRHAKRLIAYRETGKLPA